MRQGTAVTRMVIIVLFLAVMAYLGVMVWQGMSDPYQFVVTYSYEMDDAVTLDGGVIRAERVIEGASTLSEILPQEGERVGAGAAVAMVYQTESALDDRRQAKSLELELEQLQYAMRRGDTVTDASVLDNQLVEDLSQLRCGMSTGSLDKLEEWGMDIRNLVVKRTGESTTDAESLAALQAAAGEIEGQLKTLRSSVAQGARRITVREGGVFSGLVDGYETLLTPEGVEGLTVARLEELRDQELQSRTDSIGKLITSSKWYFAAPVGEEDAKRLSEGKVYTLDFSGDFNQSVSMTLERLGAQESGRRMAVFSSDRYLNKITLARFVSAKLVFQRYTGVRIPDRALRVLDNDDGSTTLGVYTLVGRRTEFKSVEIIREGEGFYLVRGTATNRKVLRPGDTLVLSSQELYNGKVVA